MRLPRARIIVVAAACAALVAAVAVAVYLRSGSDPRRGLRQAWARQGVERPNVVLITLDTTRADHIGCYGDADARTPAIDALAQDGVLFSQAASPAPLTLAAHASVMTGLYPTYHGIRLNGTTALGQGQTTLAELFSARGYQTGAFIGAFVLDGRWGLNQGFDVYDDRFDMKKFKHLDLAGVQRPGNEVMDAALRWLDGRRTDRPFFAWIHLYDPHTPYDPPEPFKTQFAGRGLPGLYDGEIAFADRQVGRCMSWLRGAGLDGRTIVVIAGDHGEALGSHGEGTHGFFIYDSAIRVPLVIATPFEQLRGVRVDTEVSLVDVFPTVLALAGIDSKANVHGRSLVPLMLKQGPVKEVDAYSECMTANLQYGWGTLRSLRSARYKFIQAPRPELYDLALDPGETTNIFDKHQAMAAAMNRELERIAEETARDAPAPETANLDRETMQRLAALGYVGTPGAAVPATPGTALADPKDKLQVFLAVQRAGELMTADEYAQAAQALEAAVREEPDMPQALVMLGACYTELGRRKEARASFDRVLKRDPKSVQALIGMANVLLDEGRTDDVVTLCRQTLSIDERNTQAYTLLGDVYIGQHEPSRALPYLEKAVEIQPKITQNRLNLAACLVEVKQLGRAETILRDVVSTEPRFPGAHFNLGVLYEELQRPEEARAAYLAEIANYPNGFKARFNLGKILAAAGDWAGSTEQMREVMRIAPKQPEGYLFLARALLQQSASLDEVQALAERGLALAGTPELKALGWFVKADVFNRKHRPDMVNLAVRNARMQLARQKGESANATPRR